VRRLVHVLVVVAPDDRDATRLGILPAGDRRFAIAAAGGATRAASVAGGLQVLRERRLAEDATWILVHDAARCLVRAESVDALIDACRDDPVGGLLAAPVPDTLKRDDGAQRVAATVPRGALWAAQTPQMFRLAMLESALAGAGADVTDEAGAVEALGHAPRLVAGPPDNWKVTHAADFALAERWLEARRGEVPA
jgi:2-C-methyl-D-erythritol 4-phosphate cytidylyltransferase